MVKKTTKNQDFEAALQELEGLVERLEQGEGSLEDSLKNFERGIALTRTCQQSLKNAEQKIQKLVEKQGKEQLKPFDSDD
ncbi:MAG: exodeoxyribonuclease VII small subunit [Gammaproteobacteria bacterium]|nr:MAG: exodeoxyribonuclease VII small subunit [Gammaproteobacteria bacterium]